MTRETELLRSSQLVNVKKIQDEKNKLCQHYARLIEQIGDIHSYVDQLTTKDKQAITLLTKDLCDALMENEKALLAVEEANQIVMNIFSGLMAKNETSTYGNYGKKNSPKKSTATFDKKM